MLWATHLTEEAERADRVIVLHQGTVRYDGSVPGLLALRCAASVEAAFLALTGSPEGMGRPGGIGEKAGNLEGAGKGTARSAAQEAQEQSPAATPAEQDKRPEETRP